MTPPADSKIVVSTDAGGYPKLTLPASSSLMKYPIGAFLIFWLGGWLMGELSVTHELLSGHAKQAAPFLFFWLCAWTIGGFFAARMCYRMLRPAIPETLTLSRGELVYDTGAQPPNFMRSNRYSGYDRNNAWKKLLQKRKVITFSDAELSSLRLRDIDSGNRLTIDKGSERIELAEGLTEVEKEWLYGQLKAAYRL